MISGLLVIVALFFFALAFTANAIQASPLALLGIGLILLAVLVELRSIHRTLRDR